METAFDTYWQAVEDGEVPAAIIVESDGVRGLAAVGYPLEGNAKAQRYALSDEPKERAMAAIFACKTTVKSLHVYYEELETPAA